jgi:5-formyltetrahydrofolate cyclo-ligase
MKQDFRNQVREVLQSLGPAARTRKSRAIAERLVGLEAFLEARTVMLYLPVAGEVEMVEVARQAWRSGKTVVAPTACDNCRTMRPFLCRPENEDIFHTHHGLRQPSRLLGEIPVEQIDLVVVPAVAFDLRGNRLGRGGGFYDRFLGRPELRAMSAGVAFAEQIVKELPVGPNDRPVDIVITDSRTWFRDARRSAGSIPADREK